MVSFDEVDGLKEKTKIVVNRVGLDTGQIGFEESPRNDRPATSSGRFQTDYRTMVEVRNNGVPASSAVPPRRRSRNPFAALASTFMGDDNSEVNIEKQASASSWLNFWKSKTKKRRLSANQNRSPIICDRLTISAPSIRRDSVTPLRRGPRHSAL